LKRVLEYGCKLILKQKPSLFVAGGNRQNEAPIDVPGQDHAGYASAHYPYISVSNEPSMNVRIKGNVVDIPARNIYPGEIIVENGHISEVLRLDSDHPPVPHFILPGFIDAHVHIESSMLVPSEFARLAVVHGTVATVSDPHEIANVCGIEGVEFMIDNSKTVPFHFYFGAPSCVPATHFETAGATLSAKEVDQLLSRKEIKYLSEMMNYPGVLHHDPEVMAKIAAARSHSKPVDGHAPGLRGEEAREYIEAGISTDHECFTKEEALDKLSYGMKILIREGSAAKNFEALADLLNDHWEQMMFCSDDKHPDSLLAGHINQLCARAVARGIDLFKVLQAACVNPVLHYGLEVGLLRKGDPADFIVIRDLEQFSLSETYINGVLVADSNGTRITPSGGQLPVNNFHCSPKKKEDFGLPAPSGTHGSVQLPVIEVLDGQLITLKSKARVIIRDNNFLASPPEDILKLVVVNRYRDAPPARSFVKNFGLKRGAIASSVAHDSHNIVAVGADDESICRAVNLIIAQKGGISCVGGEERVLPLPVGGLMSQQDGVLVARDYSAMDSMAKALGARLQAPFMTLSFMALLVIPHLKLSDLGLFDGDAFRLV
jgi:adenine deaminase